MRLVISVLSNRDHKPAFTQSLANLHAHIAMNGSKFGITTHSLRITEKVSNLAQGRQTAFESALSGGFTHILCIDDDSKFRHDAAEILLSRKVSAIGVNFVHKDHTEKRFTAIGFDHQRIDSRGKKGIEEILQIGFGMFLLDLSVLKNIEPPYFENPWNPETRALLCEDIYFCRKLKKHDIKIYVDHDVSQHVAHVGDMPYSLNT